MDSLPIQCGDVLAGKYRVERVLGVGGMGVVVAATHLQLRQWVALKLMLPEALGDSRLVERFAREARAAVRLKSDHVARVLDVGTLESGSPYMVMEYLEGSDLASVLASGRRLSVAEAVDYVLQACDAVAEAHSMGIVHRDLKPRNLFLTRRNDGRELVKVLDFGIAKDMSSGTDLSLTRTAEIFGSPNYMSPEQLRSSRGADERSDIWSLGVILYELLAGVLPFLAETITHLITMVLTDEPRPIPTFRADVPDALYRVVARCLEKNPAARFASVADLALALEPFAPRDSRDLAARIGRITRASRPTPEPAVPAVPEHAPTPLPPGTGANWWARTERSRGSRARVLSVAAGMAVLVVLGLVGGVAATRSSRVAAAPVLSVASDVSAGAAKTAAVSTATEPSALPPATTPSPGARPPAAVPSVASALADAGASRPSRPRHDVVAPPASAPVNDPPRYRTTW